jgi:uncharacterized protein YjbI with pentapeptide repeats
MLKGANLRGAILIEANLQRADLQAANLQEAHLAGARLQGAESLTIKRLSKTKTLYQAELDEDLRGQIEKDCPDLLKEPESFV